MMTACFVSLSFAGLVVLARSLNPIPSRTRPLNSSAPMVLWLKPWESRSLPGLPRTKQFLFTCHDQTKRRFLSGRRRFCLSYADVARRVDRSERALATARWSRSRTHSPAADRLPDLDRSAGKNRRAKNIALAPIGQPSSRITRHAYVLRQASWRAADWTNIFWVCILVHTPSAKIAISFHPKGRVPWPSLYRFPREPYPQPRKRASPRRSTSTR